MPEAHKESVPSNERSSLKIYPNPASELLRIEYPAANLDGYVRLMDMQGRVRRELRLPGSGHLAEIPVTGMPNGHYVAQWYYDGLVGYVKVIISH